MADWFGFGTLFKVGNGASPEVFTKVAHVQSVTPPGVTAGTVETTHTESTSAMRTYLYGLLDGGEATFTCNFLPTDSTQDASNGLYAKQAARAVSNFQILMTDTSPGSTFSFAGIITNIQPSAMGIDETVVTLDVTVKVSGAVTLA